MKNWLILTIAILDEVIATTTLKSTYGFTKLIPSFMVYLGYGISFYFLSLSLKSIAVGIMGRIRCSFCYRDCMAYLCPIANKEGAFSI